MKKFLKWFSIILGVVIIFVVGTVTYINSAFPNVGEAQPISVSMDSAIVSRGSYLFNHVTGCNDCHAENDYSRFGNPVIAGTEGKGGNMYPPEAGFPGTFYAPNITPYHLGKWTDGEILRAITTGVRNDGEPLFPLMPYSAYRYLSKEDGEAIVAYIRTLKPIENDVPESEASFPFSVILRTIPQPAEPMQQPDPSDLIAVGKYLTYIGGCMDCHTPVDDKKQPVKGLEFSGGYEYPLPTGGIVRTANITPDVETGIGAWSKEDFLARFRFYKDNDSLFINKGEFNTLMPWYVYSGMTDEDLGAIYDYLRTQKPVKNMVERFVP
ncbi:MAG: c-type cytochrome [Melioribacteraceae bacterium]|nr:c-type cytochrome [Melioribacteraceae bacterium]